MDAPTPLMRDSSVQMERSVNSVAELYSGYMSEIPLAARRYSPVRLIKTPDDIARCYSTECQAV